MRKRRRFRRRFSPSQVAYAERFLAHVEERRCRPFGAGDVTRILGALESPDELIRAQAVRELCPCRVSWPVFHLWRKVVQRMRRDPSPLVRANARHVEEDAREVLALEALREKVQESEEEAGYLVDRTNRQDQRHHCRTSRARR